MPAVFGLKGHSIVFDTGSAVPAEAPFLELRDRGGAVTPEVFPKSDGTTYVCGISSESHASASAMLMRRCGEDSRQRGRRVVNGRVERHGLLSSPLVVIGGRPV
jgi:hypothetical protein